MKQISIALILILISISISISVSAQTNRSMILDKIRSGATEIENASEVLRGAPVVVEIEGENGKKKSAGDPQPMGFLQHPTP